MRARSSRRCSEARSSEAAVRSRDCVREDEVLDALGAFSRREGMDPELREHVDGCASCSEVVALADALLEDHRILVTEAQVPSSAIVWWRAQMRSRREAQQVVTQPITFVQGLILACAAGLTVAAAGFFLPTFRRALQWFASTDLPLPAFSISFTPDILASPIVLAAGAGLLICALIVPLLLYLTFQEE